MGEQNDIGEQNNDVEEIDDIEEIDELQHKIEEIDIDDDQDQQYDDIDQNELKDHHIDTDDNNVNPQHPNPLHKSNYGSQYEQYLQKNNAEAYEPTDAQNNYINPLHDIPNPDDQRDNVQHSSNSKLENQSFISVPNQSLPLLEETHDGKVLSTPLNESYEIKQDRLKFFLEENDNFEK
jgi:hypothetical protein